MVNGNGIAADIEVIEFDDGIPEMPAFEDEGDTQVSRKKNGNQSTEPLKRRRAIIVRPVPQRGLPATWYRSKLTVAKIVRKWEPQIPKMNSNEQIDYDIGQLKKRLVKACLSVQRIIGVMNTKGGAGKTPLTALMAVILSDVITELIVAIDGNENNGTLNEYLGIEREDVTLLEQAINLRDQINGHAAMAEHFGKYPQSSLRVIVSNLNIQDGEAEGEGDSLTDSFSLEEYMDFVRTVKKHCQSVIADSGNGLKRPSNRGLTYVADALVFAALGSVQDKINGLVFTMHTYSQHGVRAKVQNGFVVMNATHPKDTKESLIKKMEVSAKQVKIRQRKEDNSIGTRTLKLNEIGITPERMFLIPFSTYIASYMDKRVPGDSISKDPDVIGRPTYRGILELLVAIFEQDAEYSEVAKVTTESSVDHQN